jgi:hypothetical protein
MAYFRDYYDRFSERYNAADPIVRLIAIAGLLLVLSIALPRFLTIVATGVDCERLPMPSIDGSNQSVLASQRAAAQQDADALALEIVAANQNLNVGDSLVLYVRFINNSMAPITLFLIPQSVIFRYNNEEIGLLMFVQNLQDNQLRGEFPDRNPPLTVRQQYTLPELESLGPRQRCTMRIELSGQRLQNANIGPGQYRVVAVYRNTTRGILPPIANNLTPTPIFRDQGVWTGQARSNDLLITIGVPGQ